MTANPTTGQLPARTVKVMLPRSAKPEFRELGGSDSDHFNQLLADQTLQALWVARADDEQRDRQYLAATAALIGAKPQNELEAMLIAQMISCHSATMECFRRGMLAEQSFEGRQANLSAANKLSRTYTMLLDALNRSRGKGQQLVRVEHVTIEAGGQAIVGAVTQGGGGNRENEDPAHAKPVLAHASDPTMRSAHPTRQRVPRAGGEGPEAMQNARRGRRERRAIA